MQVETVEGPTPNGGVRAEVHYLDAANEPVDKEEAVACEVVEFDAEGQVIQRTYASLGDVEREVD